MGVAAAAAVNVGMRDSEVNDEGELQPIAARVLMKVLYGARMARFDLLRPMCALATHITKWTSHCDKALHRLMCFIDCVRVDLIAHGAVCLSRTIYLFSS